MNNYEKTVTAMVLKAYALVGQEDKQIQIKGWEHRNKMKGIYAQD